MDTLDTAIRLMVIGQIIVISLFLSVRGPRAVSIPLVLLQVSAAAYLIKSSAVLSAAVPLIEAPVFLMAMASPYLVWACANILFEFHRPPVWVMVVFPLATVSWVGFNVLTGTSPVLIHAASIAFSLAAVLHAIYSVLSGSLDDLSEPRRLFRLCFVTCISVVAAYILIIELVFVSQSVPPAWVPVTNALLIGTVYLAISVPLLSYSRHLLPEHDLPQTDEDPGLDLAEQEMHKSLLAAMDNRAYARTGLTIRQLAEELDIPEHQLRALINTRLGHKNFSAFLNGYRIDEARTRLADPKQARTQILTIALDAGFASLPPFNRAFREATDMTPSDYRREKLKPPEVVTQLHQP
ncbi:MAG: helix-turn-helix domain-containing protein [Woeseiaceae bacterium]|nr:helix-turn-helix domain-containing protein [Woeseiaceae bacterium]